MRLLQELLFIKFYRVRGLLRTAFAISNLDFHAPSRIVLKEMAFTSHPDAVLEQLCKYTLAEFLVRARISEASPRP